MIYLVLYDISSDKMRNKVARRLVAEGYERIQLSVFTGIWDPKDNMLLWRDLNKWVKADDAGKICVVKVSKASFKDMHILGTFAGDLNYLAGDEHTMII